MYGQGGSGGGVVAGASTSAAGIAMLPNTGGNSMLMYLGIAAVVLGAVAVMLQVAVAGYRKYTLR
jgi:LPXTG-motif cell wall-anchored protein